MFIVVDDPSNQIPVPAYIAVCPECCGNLRALVNELEQCERPAGTFKVFTPTLYCQNDDTHGIEMTDDWFGTYEAVAGWFRTITVKLPFFYIN